MNTTLEEKKKRLTREIEVAKLRLENNVENIEISDYFFSQFNLKNKIGDILSISNNHNIGIFTDFLLTKGSFFSKVISVLKQLVGLNKK